MSVLRLFTEWAGDPSKIREEYMKVCLRDGAQEKDPDPRRWDKMVSLMIMVLQKGAYQRH